MADRYDPKLSVRPPGERKTAEAASDSDPLAELARIVSGRPPFDPAPAGKGKAVASAPPPEPDVERDLEAELLNDLQASFAAIREPLESASTAAPEPEAQPEPPPVLPLRAAVEPPPRAPEPKPEPPPRRQESLDFDISQAFEEAAFVPPSKPAPRAEPPKSYVSPTRGPAAPQNRGDLPVRAAPPALRPPPARAEHMPVARGEPVPPRIDRPAPPQSKADKGSLLRRVVGPQRADRPNLPLRPLPEADESNAAEPAYAPRVVAPKPPRAEAVPLPSRFAPPKAATPPPPPLPRRQPAPEPVAQPPAEDDFELADLAGELEGPFEDEFTLDDLEAYGSDDEFPPFPEEELATLKRRRTGRVFAVIAGMLAIVALGGAAVFLYRSDAATGAPPPIIAADSGPTKVPPEETGAVETDPQGKLIYDRVDESSDGSETTLVTSGDAEIGNIPATDADVADNPISRVIIPGGPGIDSPLAADGGETVIAESDPPADGDSDIGPRMVRTVVVKPDGTIVSSEATGVDENGNALPQSEESDVAVAVPEPGRSDMDAVLDGGDLAVNPDPLSNPAAEEAVAEVPPAAEPIPALPEPAMVRTLPSPQPESAVDPVEVVAPPPAPEATPPARQEQTIVATRDSANGPIDLTPGTAPAAGPAQSAGGVLVQVTAVRSEQEAVSAYRGLQQRYPGILGAFQPNIVRADLGDRGIYYRVRVGPFSGGDATRLCEDLKAAGADCIIAR